MSIERNQWIVASVIAGLVLVFIFAVWVPESRKLARYQERIEAAELALGPNFNQPAVLATRMQEVEELQARMDSSDRYIAADPDLAELVRSLTEAAKANQVRDQEFSIKTNRDYKQYSEIPVELETRGSFDAVYGLIEAIEMMPRVVRIDGLSLRTVGRGSQRVQPEMEATFRMSGFFTERQEGGS